MAVPKKRTSKSKKNLRKTVWKQKALKSSIQAYFLADSVFKKKSSGYIEPVRPFLGFGKPPKREVKN